MRNSTEHRPDLVLQRSQPISIDKTNLLYNLFVMEIAAASNPPQDLDAIFAALADPTRRAILSRLTRGQASVNEIAEPFAISQPAVSRHLKVLEQAGLIERNVDAQRRPARLNAANMAAAAEWLDGFKAFWGASFNQLDALLIDLQQTDQTDQKDEQDG